MSVSRSWIGAGFLAGCLACLGCSSSVPLLERCDITAQDCLSPSDNCLPVVDARGLRGACVPAGRVQPGEPCQTVNDCTRGYYCVNNGASSVCERLCELARADGGSPCENGGTCRPFRDTPELGHCGPGRTRDAFEPDDTFGTGHAIMENTPEMHTFDISGDVDWVSVDSPTMATWEFRTSALTGSADTLLQVHRAQGSGTMMVASDDDGGGGLASSVRYSFMGRIYVRVSERLGRGGAAVGYTLTARGANCASVEFAGACDGSTCGAANFTVNCGGSSTCAQNSMCTSTGRCLCLPGFTTVSCSGAMCSSCAFPDWWCRPAIPRCDESPAAISGTCVCSDGRRRPTACGSTTSCETLCTR